MDQVSVVFQDSKLLKASIADNVRLGRPGASDEEVLSALHDAAVRRHTQSCRRACIPRLDRKACIFPVASSSA